MTDDPSTATFPGAQAPDRVRQVDSAGVGIEVYEWGDESAPPLMLAHGGFDFARTFDVFAPLLAAGGWRVVSWDQRGHGFSDHAALYSWDADIRDAVAVMDSTSLDPLPVVGHSKGGGILLQMAEVAPWRITRMVNLDGLPSGRKAPDVADHERTRMLADELASWLGHHRRTHELRRKPGTVEELAERRGSMNPRLTPEWLRYLAAIGTVASEDGHRWPIDPQLRFGGFGPFRPDWNLERLPGLAVPLLGVLSTIEEPMGWGTSFADVEPHLPPGARVLELADTGHFVHVERPQAIADLVLEFLG
ncbi:alpha/beta fold hydrolase [Actinomarinicola tropica]|uniref:Alpha/beta fold hydrolase n=1 Tax=Actinomarinicola tropica TaxID=2789776 RepID=A0A5Q2RPW0_9ACTN|nr:alpha/beta hydrolase [Actinomarinicola tropica]QGG96611.1 alpha/beta fold hydrolase [Actinomarinicola tropica]